MAQTVFWSWQSDCPARETRQVIREALSDALSRIAAELEESERPEIDHDTKDVAGSPDIVATILAKIERAAVFVADVTPIAISKTGKQLANPNVLIELGYAKHALGVERVITIWNTALTNARPEDLPFDMRHRRGPVAFDLPEGAPRDQFRKVRLFLTDELERRIRACLTTLPLRPAEPTNWQAAELHLPGLWLKGQEPLLVNLGSDGTIGMRTGGPPFGFARLLPDQWSPTTGSNRILDSATGHPLPLGRSSGLDYGPATGGFLVFRSSEKVRNEGVTPTATRWFRDTGELWGIAACFFNNGGDDPDVLATTYAIERWIGWIEGNIRVATALGGKGPWHLKLGMEGLAGTAWPNRFGRMDGTVRALENRIEYDGVLADTSREAIIETVRQAFNLVLECYGFDHVEAAEFSQFAQL